MSISSRIPHFYQRTSTERLHHLAEQAQLTLFEQHALKGGGLTLEKADALIENVFGLYHLPLGLATNFLINGRDVLVPMCIEEPSVVAAASRAALLIRESGGFVAQAGQPIMIGQVHLTEVPNTEAACQAILAATPTLLALGNQTCSSLHKYGIGVKGIEVRILTSSMGRNPGTLVVHILVNCGDAMGANITNTIAEALGPSLAQLSQATLGIQILSNLAVHRRVQVRAVVPVASLQTKEQDGTILRDRMVAASHFATLDPYRAATHNKGIMNGIDAVALATGNDWRGIEASVHAFAAHSGTYKPVTAWQVNAQGDLEGVLDIPLAVGTQGGAIAVHPGAQICLKILNVSTSAALAEVMGCVGLATNLAALRALTSGGIQQAHMPLHNRTKPFRNQKP